MLLAPINVSASGDNTIVAAVASKRIRVHSFQIVNQVATAQAVKFRDDSPADLHAAIPLPLAIGGSIGPVTAPPAAYEDQLFQTGAGNALGLNLSAATAVTGYVFYSLE